MQVAKSEASARVAAYLRACGLDSSWGAVGTSRAEMRGVLTGMGAFVHGADQRHLLPGVFHFFGGVPEDKVDALLDYTEAALGMTTDDGPDAKRQKTE